MSSLFVNVNVTVLSRLSGSLVSELGHEISQKKLKCTSFKRIKGSNEITLGRVEISAGAQGRENLSSLQNEGRHMEAVVLLAAG